MFSKLHGTLAGIIVGVIVGFFFGAVIGGFFGLVVFVIAVLACTSIGRNHHDGIY